MKGKKFAVILSGCGVYDGAEINEVVLTLLALETNGVSYQCYAPDISQHHVINHLTGQELSGERNVLTESARIVRGSVKNLLHCSPNDYDALVVPGGFGVAKNLSDFAFEGADFQLDPTVLSVLRGFKLQNKPAGYMCIAPVLLPLVYGRGVKLTVGNDENTISIVEQLGGSHQRASFDQIVADEINKVVSTPAYMLSGSIAEAKQGIDKLIQKLIDMS